MSLSAKKYFEVLTFADCNNCVFYDPAEGYCEKVSQNKKPYSEICRAFELSAFGGQWYDLTEPERKEFNKIYKQNNENT